MSSSSSSLQRECRQFSLCEIKDATNDFDEGKVIGRGGEGTVYDGVIYDYQKKTNTRVAVKCLSTNSNCFEEEIRVVSDLHHANIVSLIGYCNESDHKILVYEFMDKGSLADNLKKGSFALSWEQWLRVCIGVARGLEHLHSGTNIPKGIIHRDLKPANILLDGNCEAKISDFGLFKVWPPDQESSHISTQLKGTPGYVAPECIKNHKITNKIDVYSFGMVLFQVLCRKSPWTCGGDDSYYPKEDDNLGHWALKNIDADLKQVISDDCLKAFTDVIGKTSRRNPVTRPTMNEVVLELENALKMQEHDKFKSYLQITLPKVPTDASSMKVYAKVLFQGTTLGIGSVVLVLVLILFEVLRRKFPRTGSDVTYDPREDDNLGQYWELHDIDSNPKHAISKDHSKEHTDSNGKTVCITPAAWPTMKEDVLKLENGLKMQEPRDHEINMCLPQVPLEPPNFSKLSSTSTAYRSFSITFLSATNLSSTVSNYWALYADDSFSRMVNTMRKPWVDTLDSFHGSFFKYKSTFNYRVLQSSLRQDGTLILVVKLYRRRIFGGDICVGLVTIDLKKLFESGDTTNYPVQLENAQVTEGKLQFSYTFGDLESVDVRKYEHSLMGTTLLEDSKIVEYNFNELFSVALKL